MYQNCFFGVIFGSFIVVCGFFSWRFFLEKGYVTMLTAGILGLGFFVLKNVNKKLNKYKKQLNNSEENKNFIDETLRLYHKKYNYNINFDKEIHGIKEVEIDVNFY